MSLLKARHTPLLSDRNATAQRLIDAALDLVESEGTVRGVNLRAISQRAGCAHTNAYNYFGSFEDLLWNALPAALDRLMAFTEDAMMGVRGVDRALEVFIGSQVEFALSHPGLYRFVWLERLEGKPPPRVTEAIAEPPRLFASFLQNLSGGLLTAEQAAGAMELMHAHLHGEICRAIAGRIEGLEIELPQRVAARSKDLWRWILADVQRSTTTSPAARRVHQAPR